jgi:hypothetical protein
MSKSMSTESTTTDIAEELRRVMGLPCVADRQPRPKLAVVDHGVQPLGCVIATKRLSHAQL